MRNILILTSETPNNWHAGSMQLLRVFQDYPAEKLCVIGPALPPSVKTLACSYRVLPFPIQRWRNTRLHRCAMSAALGIRWFRPSGRTIRNEIGSFRPDAVFTVMDNVSYFLTAYDYAKSNGLPLITMTMDEPDSFEKIFPFLTRLQQQAIGQVYRYAENNLCVSRQMTAHIACKFGCRTETFYFGPPDGMSPRPAELSRANRVPGILTLGYAGGLSYGYREALQAIAEALVNHPVRIRIYSRDKLNWDQWPNVEYAGCFPHDELWNKFQQECDASLLIYAFAHPEGRLYRTHFPTKLSEYTWVGMPLVMVGPDYATGIIWGMEHPDVALVETHDRLDTLGAQLLALEQDADRRAEMSKAAARVSVAEFDPVRIRKTFMQYMAYGE